ncbi:hypothetical protein TSAR_008512 [Trichomalopsis sarcophagae]|uniref:Uncharacterized protein n=1 Tax=Trichomalopsis sarcophagae TaxID=543379 RepID=A0A232EPU6_9HYME|nr:hypothetical protein TSAR_008512 [Trichomalopsis sarcophagae]
MATVIGDTFLDNVISRDKESVDGLPLCSAARKGWQIQVCVRARQVPGRGLIRVSYKKPSILGTTPLLAWYPYLQLQPISTLFQPKPQSLSLCTIVKKDTINFELTLVVNFREIPNM